MLSIEKAYEFYTIFKSLPNKNINMTILNWSPMQAKTKLLFETPGTHNIQKVIVGFEYDYIFERHYRSGEMFQKHVNDIVVSSVSFESEEGSDELEKVVRDNLNLISSVLFDFVQVSGKVKFVYTRAEFAGEDLDGNDVLTIIFPDGRYMQILYKCVNNELKIFTMYTDTAYYNIENGERINHDERTHA